MQEPLNSSYPVLPLRDIVVFPHMIVPLFVGRDKSVRALEEVMQDDKQILLSSQIDPADDDPNTDGIYRTGVLANVLQLLKLPDGTVKVLVEGQARVTITDFIENDVFFEASAEYLHEEDGDLATIEALLRRPQESEETPTLTCRDLEMDLLTRKVTRGGREITLTPREFQILEFFLRRKNRVVTRTMLLEGVWDYHFDPQTNIVDVHVSKLRKQLDAEGDAPLIRTIRGSGYMLSDEG